MRTPAAAVTTIRNPGNPQPSNRAPDAQIIQILNPRHQEPPSQISFPSRPFIQMPHFHLEFYSPEFYAAPKIEYPANQPLPARSAYGNRRPSSGTIPLLPSRRSPWPRTRRLPLRRDCPLPSRHPQRDRCGQAPRLPQPVPTTPLQSPHRFGRYSPNTPGPSPLVPAYPPLARSNRRRTTQQRPPSRPPGLPSRACAHLRHGPSNLR